MSISYHATATRVSCNQNRDAVASEESRPCSTSRIGSVVGMSGEYMGMNENL